jgi:hypothetical protein
MVNAVQGELRDNRRLGVGVPAANYLACNNFDALRERARQ